MWKILIGTLLLGGLSILFSIGASFGWAYPWVHYFKGPEMPRIHRAFADAHANVIVSTGQWLTRSYYPSYWEEYYWSEGIFRINCAQIEPISCPDDTFVLDAALDSKGRVWLLIAEGVDNRHYYFDRPFNTASETSATGVGYRDSGLYLENRRFGWIEGDALIEDANLTEVVPWTPVAMCSDPAGRVYVFSWRWVPDGDDSRGSESFVSWWSGEHPGNVHVSPIPDIFPAANILYHAGRYPEFGPDGLAYFLLQCLLDDSTRGYKYAVLSLNPDTEEWGVYDDEDSPFLDSAIHNFRVDDNNLKWFGTEDGLVCFDGENWACFTTENSAIPFNQVLEIDYDDIDDVHYVLCQSSDFWSEAASAFSMLRSDGRFSDNPVYFDAPGTAVLSSQRMSNDSRGVWWFRGIHGSLIYSYDHSVLLQWDSRDWLDTFYNVGYIGSVSSGRDFCVSAQCIMIW